MKRPLAYLAGTGRSVPVKVVTNNDFAALGLETSHEWIVERTGITERRIAGPGESTCSLAADAARVAMQRAHVNAGELDVIVLSTATPDRLLPATAVDLQAALGATRAAAFDVSAACSGFLYNLQVAEGLIAAGSHETVLVVSAEKMSAIVDWTDRSTCVLFGDGAGAAVLQRSKQGKGILSSFIRSDGTLAELLFRPGGGATVPFTQAVLSDRSHFVKMAGPEVTCGRSTPDSSRVMPNAAHSRPGPRARSRGVESGRRRRMNSMPSSGSSARISTAAPMPRASAARFKVRQEP